MVILNRKRWLLLLIALGLVTTGVHAGPAVYWKSASLDISYNKCVQRAPLAIKFEIVVNKVDKKKHGALGSNDNSTIVVHCVSTGSNRSKVITFVTGYKRKQIDEIAIQVTSAMRSGLFE